MKSKIHPKYVPCTVTCGCGSSFVTRASVETLNVEICSSCHPFYTGKQKFVDAAGRVEKFMRRYGMKGESLAKARTKTDQDS
jgi:large subunit ribosomal protein L31